MAELKGWAGNMSPPERAVDVAEEVMIEDKQYTVREALGRACSQRLRLGRQAWTCGVQRIGHKEQRMRSAVHGTDG